VTEEVALEDLIVMEGTTFFVSDPRGDVRARASEGLFVADVRHLSVWELLLDGEPMHLLSSRALAYDNARIFGTSPGALIGHSAPFTVSRVRQVDDGVVERLLVENHSAKRCSLDIDLRFASDFIDIFEARGPGFAESSTGEARDWTDRDGRRIRLCHEQTGFARETQLLFDRGFELVDSRVRFHVELAPRERWDATVRISCKGDGINRARPARHGEHGTGDGRASSLRDIEPPRLETDREFLALTYEQSIADLVALSLPARDAEGAGVPAAGLPWFMTLFGRDSLITAYQALPFLPQLARSTLLALAALQATEDDPFRDAEPGKILHELRRGKLATLGIIPHTPYYGTHDATPLFLVLLDEYERWSGDGELVRELEDPARRALAWIETHGDPDGDGYLEYRRRSRGGLDNQCWKDSAEAVVFADGTRARGPLALCEIQGYAYDARLRAARLARSHWHDVALAERLEHDAALLRQRFDDDFWCEERGHFALALDGDKRRVDSCSSNNGHLLWSGIVAQERAGTLVERLMSSDMYSGWGLRTLSARDGAYNPIGYHIGTVWPHDTGLVAEGMRRYGHGECAARVVTSLLDAAAYFGHRLPEVFAGFDRERTGMPVEYPTASRPQAWAAGAVLLGLRTLLGMDARDGRVQANPALPDALRLRLKGVPIAGSRVEVP
jgi:glycogen debranching enzyme